MKDVIIKLLGFYVEYRLYLNRMKSDFWGRIDREGIINRFGLDV